MKIRQQLLLRAVVLTGILFLAFNSILLQASTIVTEEPGNTVVSDADHDLQIRVCDPTSPALACSLPPGAALPFYRNFADITGANITALPNGLVELAIDLNGAFPNDPPPSSPWRYFWQFENGCINGQPGPTDKDGVRVLWDGSIFTANWYEITDCEPRTIQQGDPLPLNLSADRNTVSVEVDICELVGRAGDPLAWHSGVRRLPFVHPDFSRTVAVDVAPDVFAFNPSPPPLVINPEEAALWHGGCSEIDIKPHSFPNSVNLNNQGNIPVAILSNLSFDAPTRVDQESLTFGPTGDEESLEHCAGSEDVNDDGLLDLVCHFNTQATGFQHGDTQGILKGLTVDGEPIFLLGRDSVRIVGR